MEWVAPLARPIARRTEEGIRDGQRIEWYRSLTSSIIHDLPLSSQIPNRSRGTGIARVLATIRLPEFGEHWNYPDSIVWSPDAQTLLVGAEAGSSGSHFSDYWIVDWVKENWRYAGGGNGATWSPDSSRINGRLHSASNRLANSMFGSFT